MQAAQLSSNEGYLGTSKQREQLQQRSSWWVFATPSRFTHRDEARLRGSAGKRGKGKRAGRLPG
jgi:hypothetical protein